MRLEMSEQLPTIGVMLQYILRIDDVCPTMRWDKFAKLRDILLELEIRPILGIVPDNQDKALQINLPRKKFWADMSHLVNQGWIPAQHGHQHIYVTQNRGILGLRSHSEFAGLPLSTQINKIATGKSILEEKLSASIYWWMAPSHSFDKNTCLALKKLGFKYISDGISLYPFTLYGLTWVPQQLWNPRKNLIGTWTIGLHLNSMTDDKLEKVSVFLRKFKKYFYRPDFTPHTSSLNSVFIPYWYSRFYLEKFILTLKK